MEKKTKIQDKFTIDALFKRACEYRSSSEFIKFIGFISRFDHYSRYNTMLVYTQNRAVTFFGGEGYWQKKFSRSVKEDARPYIILAPGGPVMLVYDIFDTEGRVTPEELLEDGLGSKPHEVWGDFNASYLVEVIDITRQWGIVVKKRPLSYFNGGFVTTIHAGKLEINLKEELSPVEQFRVLIHELAHLLLGHTGHQELSNASTSKTIKLTTRRLSRNAEELEAETVSYLILKRLGLESRSAEYIAGYIENDELLLEINYEVIIKTADKIESLFIDKVDKDIIRPGAELIQKAKALKLKLLEKQAKQEIKILDELDKE
ncbi:MAG: ImmA/IrrE family metallo-endopeptidase [Marinilabiliaceae bacterium]|nr:ImmA/IrrE family metallo-endopeptidase [Marinilabiliaceae bacterium]